MAKAKLITIDRPTSVTRERVREVVVRIAAQFANDKKRKRAAQPATKKDTVKGSSKC